LFEIHKNYICKVRILSELAGVSVVVVTKNDDHVEAINIALRDAGHAAHCVRVEKVSQLQNMAMDFKVDSVFVRSYGIYTSDQGKSKNIK